METNQAKAIRKMHDFYAFKPDAEIVQKEFGFYVLDKWQEQGYLKKPDEVEDYWGYLCGIFHYDPPALVDVMGLGWCEAELFPRFEEKLLEDRGDHEVIQDFAGRAVLMFKGRREGFMPEYIDHPVKDWRTWEEDVKWRLDPHSEGRSRLTESQLRRAVEGQKQGLHITQRVIGGYMYLRSLMGPVDLLYKFYDEPELIHDCMQTWLKLADHVIAVHQEQVSFDELFFGEDICYNTGSLISPDMIREFLFPYYQQLIDNMRRRNRGRELVLQLDTDGYCNAVIDLYRELGFRYFSPCEVASHCDVVEIGKQYPDLLLSGGIDKRVLAGSKEDIARHVDSIMSYMKKRGGYIPTCDHGVPAEVPFENYLYYRELMSRY